jgi:beta-xylosidase
VIEYVNASSLNNCAAQLGKNVQSLSYWINEDVHLTAYQADRAAKAAGAHPQEIWPDWYEASADAGR